MAQQRIMILRKPAQEQTRRAEYREGAGMADAAGTTAECLVHTSQLGQDSVCVKVFQSVKHTHGLAFGSLAGNSDL